MRIAENKRINVSLAEVKTAMKPQMLATPSVGSCVVITLYDELMGIGSMAHIMLPDINLAKAKKNRAKFANTAVEIMLKEMIDLGAAKRRIKARIVGGANMFPSVNRSNAMHIGARNIAAVKDELKKRKIRLVAEDTEGSYGRSVEFFIETGVVRTKSALHGNKEI
ncbi:MAG: chemotaxis protein CheD [Deltaproteobacteria bacterium]|nr:chemotaxis protein CheD [Deltaproteobacteria bacterium]MBW2117973.1 chemotaxis protein CheD [Deltaproteobacteria bacterium]